METDNAVLQCYVLQRKHIALLSRSHTCLSTHTYIAIILASLFIFLVLLRSDSIFEPYIQDLGSCGNGICFQNGYGNVLDFCLNKFLDILKLI